MTERSRIILAAEKRKRRRARREAREIRKAMRIIEHGVDELVREVNEEEEFRVRSLANFVPVAQYATKPIDEFEIGSIGRVRLVRVPK